MPVGLGMQLTACCHIVHVPAPRQTQTERFEHGAGTREAVLDVQAY